MSLLVLVCVGVGGALGALCRHVASGRMKAHFKSAFPWPTLFINFAACTLAGAALALAAHMNQTAYLALTMGFLGGFSTLSTMNCEAVDLVVRGQVSTGAVYLFVTYAGTLGAAALGFAIFSMFVA